MTWPKKILLLQSDGKSMEEQNLCRLFECVTTLINFIWKCISWSSNKDTKDKMFCHIIKLSTNKVKSARKSMSK